MRSRASSLPWAVAAAALLVYLVVVTLMNDLDPLRRGPEITEVR